jgi:hypothetical protein
VRALPLAPGINVGGHYKWHIFLSPLSFFLSFFLSSGSLLILTDGVVIGFSNFAWALSEMPGKHFLKKPKKRKVLRIA